jgi:hypothetical protein
MWNELGNQVIDQLIHAVITVFIVDRVLTWHEKRKWAGVRELFLVQSDRAISDNLRIWAAWLEEVVKDAPILPISDEGRARLRVKTKRTAPYLPTVERFIDDIKGMSTPKYGYPFKPKIIEGLRLNLIVFLVEKEFPKDHPSWKKLGDDLSVSIQKLLELVDKFSGMLEPDVAFPILRLSLELDKLTTKEHEMDIQSEGTRIEVAESLASAISWSFRFKTYVLRHRKYLNWEVLDDQK